MSQAFTPLSKAEKAMIVRLLRYAADDKRLMAGSKASDLADQIEDAEVLALG